MNVPAWPSEPIRLFAANFWLRCDAARVAGIFKDSGASRSTASTLAGVLDFLVFSGCTVNPLRKMQVLRQSAMGVRFTADAPGSRVPGFSITWVRVIDNTVLRTL